MRTRKRFLAIDDVMPGMVLGAPALAQDHGVMGLKFPSGLVLSQESVDQLRAHQAEWVQVEEPDPRSDEEVAQDVVRAETDLKRQFGHLDLEQPGLAGLFQQLVAYRSGT